LAGERLILTALAADCVPGTEASDMELRRGGLSYTVDTFEDLSEKFPGAELFLLVGTDMFLTLETWYSFDRLVGLCTIAPFVRRDGEDGKISRHAEYLRVRYGAAVRIIEKDALDVSSTELRRLIALGRGRELLPEKIYERIIEKRHYGARPDLAWLRERAYAMLNPNRVTHVSGTELEAVRLARHWDADEYDAAEAAILHDITKKLSDNEQLLLCERYGIIVGGAEKSSPKLLHAVTGAALARERFGVSDRVYGAIRWHTTGKPDMSRLEKIIYLADYIEPSREFDGVEALRRLAYEDIDGAMILGLQMSLDDITARGAAVHQSSAAAAEFLRDRRDPVNEIRKK
jgi:nicotinate-nucleotide adenylyltransferase